MFIQQREDLGNGINWLRTLKNIQKELGENYEKILVKDEMAFDRNGGIW